MKAISAAVLVDLRERFGNSVSSADLYAYDPKVLNAARAGALSKVGRGLFALSNASGAKAKAPVFDREAELANITEKFEVLELLSDGLIEGNIRSMLVAGAPGVGKTYTLEKKLRAANINGKIQSFTEVKGTISAIGLFMILWENSQKGQVLVLDDIDSIYGDEEAMNLLKTALDTSQRRVISWIKDSKFLEERGIPNQFEYEGQIVFLTNVDLDTVLEKGGKMAPHVSALLSRACFLNLGIHKPEQILLRIEQVLRTSRMAEDLGLSKSQVVQAMDWLNSNVSGLRAISLRTVIQLAGYMKTTSDWQKLARATMLTVRR